jgi:transposase
MTRRKFNKELKLQILSEIDAGKPVSQVAREYEVDAPQIYKWQKTFAKYGDNAFQGNGHLYSLEAKIADLERKVGQLTMENELLKKARTLLQTSFSKTRSKGQP